jgi:hypothetical protein
LEQGGTFTADELKTATEALPDAGRVDTLRTLTQALEGSGEQKTEYWRNRILPYWKSIWPKWEIYKTPALAEPIAQLCLAAGEMFTDALEALHSWLQPVSSHGVVDKLDKTKLSRRYPATALEFLYIVVDLHARWPPHKLGNCLNDIKEADLGLEEDQRFRRLMELVRIHE